MEKKYQVFISSTYTDLIEERQKAVEAILTAGHIPAGMELFHAGDETQKELISEWIEDSDIYVLILGGRYGSLDSDGMGYTHWEYEKAKELGKPIFSLVLTEDYLNKKVEDKKLKATDLSYNDDKLVTFRDEVMSKIVSNIDNIVQIEAEVIKSINRIIKKRENDLDGWIKGSSLKELEALRQENKELSSDLMNRQSEVIGMQKKAKPVKDDYIGEFSFDAIREVLEASVITEEQFDDAIRELETKKNEYFPSGPEYDEYISSISSTRGSSALQYFVYSRPRLLAKEFQKPKDNPLDKIINDNFVSLWEQYSLVVKQVVVSGTNLSGTNFKLTQYGMKFIGMLDIFSVENEK